MPILCLNTYHIPRARSSRRTAATAAAGLGGWRSGGSNSEATDALLPLRLLAPSRATQLLKSDMSGGSQRSRSMHSGEKMASVDCDVGCMTRVPRAALKPSARRIATGRTSVPNCGSRHDPEMTGLRLEGVCCSEIGRPAVHAAHPLRLALKLRMYRMECQDTTAEARGCACTRSLESARGKFCLRSTRGFEGRQLAARRLAANAAPLLGWRLSQRQHRHLLRLRLPLRRAGPPAAARLRRPFLCSAPSPAESSHPTAEGRGVGQAGGPLSRLCATHIECQRVHPRGREEEGDDGGVATVSRHMQRGRAILQGRRRRGREEGGGDVRGGGAGGRGTRPGVGRGGRQASAGGHRGAIWTTGAPARPPSTGPNPRGLSPIA